MKNFFFSISYTFIDWMIKKRLSQYVFNMFDPEYPSYEFKVIVERKKNNGYKN